MKIPLLNLDIKFNTFFKKGLKYIDDSYGCFFITGQQGTGKSYFAVYLATLQDKTKVNYIKTNMKSLNIPGYKIEYFNTINELYCDTDEYCIYIIDEISRKYDKNSRTDTSFYAWLNQSRKRKRVVILITQEWRELPMWIRRPCKIMISTKPTFILRHFGIFTSVISDGTNLIFDKDTGDYIAPPLRTIVYKRNRKIADMYDTFEPINQL